MTADLTTAVTDFLDHRRALGRKYLTEEADAAAAAALSPTSTGCSA